MSFGTRKFFKRYIAFLIALLLFMGNSLSMSANVTINRVDFKYDDSLPYRSYMVARMNCYGYAIHVYCFRQAYKQFPGEFCNKGEPHYSLYNSYLKSFYEWKNLYHFVHDRIIEDFNYLNKTHNEYNIYETTFTSIVPAGFRKIAMTINQYGNYPDAHFYARDINGNWSHKQGSLSITNRSISSNVIITDNNFQTVCKEGGYTDGVRYYLINKPYIIDYEHEYEDIVSSSATYTKLNVRDRAGDEILKSATVNGNWYARFDNPNDVDYYRYVPTISGTCRITTDYQQGYETSVFLFNSFGELIKHDVSTTKNGVVDFYLYANSVYYFSMISTFGKVHNYIQYIYRI